MRETVAMEGAVLVLAGCANMPVKSDVATVALPNENREVHIAEALMVVDSLGFVPSQHGGGERVEFKDPQGDEEVLVRRFRHNSAMGESYPATLSLVLKAGRIRIIADRARGTPATQEIAKEFETA